MDERNQTPAQQTLWFQFGMFVFAGTLVTLHAEMRTWKWLGYLLTIALSASFMVYRDAIRRAGYRHNEPPAAEDEKS